MDVQSFKKKIKTINKTTTDGLFYDDYVKHLDQLFEFGAQLTMEEYDDLIRTIMMSVVQNDMFQRLVEYIKKNEKIKNYK